MSARSELLTSAEQLQRSAEALADSPADFVSGARHALESVRGAYRALLAWHRFPPLGDDLATLSVRAERVASMIRTYRKRALQLEALVASFSDNQRATVEQRETAVTGFYTARNSLSVVMGTLPLYVVEEAIPFLNRAQATRSGRRNDLEERRAQPNTRPTVRPTTRHDPHVALA